MCIYILTLVCYNDNVERGERTMAKPKSKKKSSDKSVALTRLLIIQAAIELIKSVIELINDLIE